MPLEINNLRYIDFPVMMIFYNEKIIKANLDSTLSSLINRNYFQCKEMEIVNKHRSNNCYDIMVPFGKVMKVYYNNMTTETYNEGFYKIKKREPSSKHDYYIANHDNMDTIFVIWFGIINEDEQIKFDKRAKDFLFNIQ
jgi:hypothetical protein